MATSVLRQPRADFAGDPFEHVTDAERLVLLMIRRHLTSARTSRSSGRLTFEVDLKDGGICDKWTTVKMREK